EKCVVYSIYNPFDTEVTAQITAEGEIAQLVKKIEPSQVYLPAYTGAPNDNAAKLANKKDVKVCFAANILRWPPFYPANYSGVILASAFSGKSSPMGSASVSSVQASLTVRVGSLRNFYTFISSLCLIAIILVVSILMVKKKLPKRKKKYCPSCKKEYPYSASFCPNCGSRLEERGKESNFKYSEIKKLIDGG
ncbi:MAG: hypothetical protein QXL86_02880, partial [Candidatus Aenigmatarchaeota archaeon]